MGTPMPRMRAHFIPCATVVIACTASASVALGTADRQHVKRFDFTANGPGKATGVRTSVTFTAVGPDRAVERIVTKLARGTRLDTSVPERCAAPDAALVAQGADACPEQSRVGKGVIEGAELGVGDVTLLNGKRETIFLTEFRNAPIRTVARESAEGRTQVIEIAAGFTLERVRLEVERVRKRGEAYLRTPDRCPTGDGSTQGALPIVTGWSRGNDWQRVASVSPLTFGAPRHPAGKIRTRGWSGCDVDCLPSVTQEISISKPKDLLGKRSK
jgi:hypothetical protein